MGLKSCDRGTSAITVDSIMCQWLKREQHTYRNCKQCALTHKHSFRLKHSNVLFIDETIYGSIPALLSSRSRRRTRSSSSQPTEYSDSSTPAAVHKTTQPHTSPPPAAGSQSPQPSTSSPTAGSQSPQRSTSSPAAAVARTPVTHSVSIIYVGELALVLGQSHVYNMLYTWLWSRATRTPPPKNNQ